MARFNGSPVYVVADSAGRGHIKMFGSFGPEQRGETVLIGGKTYSVTSDGRVSIPKSVMNAYGVNNENGRKTIIARCSYNHTDGFAVQVLKPKSAPPVGAKSHTLAKMKHVKLGVENVLAPSDSGDWTFSD
jgi:hypothetical protein